MPHVILYDGLCASCNRWVRFVLDRDRRDRFRFAPLDGAFARERLRATGRGAGTLDTLYVVTEDGRVLDRARATLFVASALGWPWRAATLLEVVPARVLDAAYDAVARARYATFGRYDACPAPRPADRAKFLDA